MKPGIVYFVGAGPGDPGLITLRGLECLQRAEVVIYDRLIPEAILKEARPEAKLIYVGKEAAQHALPQEKINELLVQEAKAGRIVCRLKGGDSFIFGRGGEEALYLQENGIPFEVVPGVTSAIAAPAYAGIPLTHREFASSVAFVTGQEDAEKTASAINWEGLAKGPDTLVFLMGMKSLEEIVSRLMENGKPADTPAALVHRGTTPSQRTLVGALGDIVEKARGADLKPPVVIVIGEVVRLREKLAWFEKRPLFGKRIVVTRSREQASELSSRLAEMGAEVVEFPVIRPVRIAPDKAFLCNLPAYDWVIFTSANGVRFFGEQLREVGRDVRALGSAKIAGIGPATRQALESLGLRVDFQPSEFVAEKVLEEFPEDPAGLHILIPRAKQARDFLPEGLREKGATVDVYHVYETLPETEGAEELRQRLSAGEIDVVCFTSSSTVQNFVEAIGDVRLSAGVMIASIGPITTKTAEESGLKVQVTAREHTIPGLVQAIERYFAGQRAGGKLLPNELETGRGNLRVF